MIKCLDHGFVRLVDSMGSDLSIVRAARVSYDAAWRAGEDQGSDNRLINYLWKNKHTTPFESVCLTFEVKAPIFIFRQWHRHRTQAYNELSARYRELPEEYYVPEADIVGEQATKNKQGRQAVIRPNIVDELAAYRGACIYGFDTYHYLLEQGWPRELARSVLPLATYSHMFATASLLNWMKFMTLRCDPHAQHEINVYGEAIQELTTGVVPVAMEAWKNARV